MKDLIAASTVGSMSNHEVRGLIGLAWLPTTSALAEAIRTILTLRLLLMLRSLLHSVAK